MPRNLINVTVAVIAFGCGVIGSTIAWSSIGGLPDQATAQVAAPSPVNPYRAKADFDRVFAEARAAAMPDRKGMPAIREKLRDTGWKMINSGR
jgi:hypothetical protein